MSALCCSRGHQVHFDTESDAVFLRRHHPCSSRRVNCLWRLACGYLCYPSLRLWNGRWWFERFEVRRRFCLPLRPKRRSHVISSIHHSGACSIFGFLDSLEFRPLGFVRFTASFNNLSFSPQILCNSSPAGGIVSSGVIQRGYNSNSTSIQ